VLVHDVGKAVLRFYRWESRRETFKLGHIYTRKIGCSLCCFKKIVFSIRDEQEVEKVECRSNGVI
jgi:hypothetical protein